MHNIETINAAVNPSPTNYELTNYKYARKQPGRRGSKYADRELWNSAVLAGKVTALMVSVERLTLDKQRMKRRAKYNKNDLKRIERLIRLRVKRIKRGYL